MSLFQKILNWISSLFKKPAQSVVAPPEVTKPVDVPVVAQPVPASDTPWLDWLLARLGWSEFDHDKELSKYWPLSGLNYTTVIGSSHAWCAMALNAALHESGYKGTGSAAAVSFVHYGTPCEDIDGAILVIEHPDGSHHVTVRRQKRCVGGNQGNKISIADYNPPHKIIAKRWPVKA